MSSSKASQQAKRDARLAAAQKRAQERRHKVRLRDSRGVDVTKKQ